MLEESSGSVCGLVKDLIGCSEDSDLRKLVLKWQ
jgi:hypothetical protein